MVPARIEKFNPFQEAFIKWGVNKRTCLLQAQPGAGKSIATMGLFLFLRQQLGYGKLLVVTAKKNADAFKKANIKHLLLLTLFSKQDMGVLYSEYDFPADIYIISNTLLSSIVNGGTPNQKRAFTELLKKTTILCIDEIHGYRSYNSTRSKAMRKVTDYYHRLIEKDPQSHRLVGITATPVFKTIEDIHPIFNLLVNPNPLGSWFRFVDRYCIMEQRQSYGSRRMYSANGSHSYKDVITFSSVVGYQNVEELHRIIDPYIFVWNKTDFNFTFNLHYYSLTEEEKEIYKASIKGLGLDKTFAIDLEFEGKRFYAYRNKSDIFYFPDKKEIRADQLWVGCEVLYNNSPAIVRGVYTKDVDAGYAVRAVKAQQCNSKAVNKLALISDLVRQKDYGALIYFNFLESVEITKRHLMQEFPNRRVVTLTGETQRFNQVVASIGKNDIVLMSSVASQSIDLYIRRLIIAENFGLTPGKIEQLVGRAARENADYRDVDVSFVLREGQNVESYFYEKLRHRLRNSKTNTFVSANSLPVSSAVFHISDRSLDESWLKKNLLWKLG